MLLGRTDKDWEFYGKNEPYFGVVSQEAFKKASLNQDSRQEFFRTGERYVKAIIDTVEEHFCPDFCPERTLDFGCGVGRLVIPLSVISQSVVGVDVSASMLKEAQANFEELGLTNISLVQGDDALTQVSGTFDFVHSFIVFQHIPPRRGEKIFASLLERLNEGGIGVLHVTYAKDFSPSKLMQYRCYQRFPLLWSLRNLVKVMPQQPMMQMNLYDLNQLFRLLQKYGCHKSVVRFSDHGTKGVILFFQKQSLPVF